MGFRPGLRRVRGWLLGGVATISLVSGCAEFRDRISSRRFREAPVKTLFPSDEPMTVLRDPDSEGDRRVRALRALKEPVLNGGSETDQAEILQILSQTATTDRSGLCRLTAIETLSRFQDPRVPPILLAAYQNAAGEPPSQKTPSEGVVPVGLRNRLFAHTNMSFTPETITSIQCRAIEAMGKAKSPEGLSLLCEIAATPVTKRELNPDEVALPIEELLNKFDVRLASIRALENYGGETKPIPILVRILQTERDVALKNRTHETLMKLTGQTFSHEAEPWLEWMASRGIPLDATKR
jgi:hypothetical protein